MNRPFGRVLSGKRDTHSLSIGNVCPGFSQGWSIRILDEQDRLVCTSRLTMAIILVERT